MLHIINYVIYNICGLFIFSFMLFYVCVYLIACFCKHMNFHGFALD